MTTFSFPLSPTVGQSYTYSGNTWTWDGVAWTLNFNASPILSAITATSFTGPLTGNVTGNVTGSLIGNVTGNISGNAGTATKFAAPAAINGVNFDGSGPVTIPSAASTLTGTTIASNVTASSLTSVGNLTALTTASCAVNGSITSSASTGALSYGTLAYSDVNIFASFTTSVNSYAQMILENTNTGPAASTDFIVSSNSGTSSTYYGDFGINGSGFVGSGSLSIPNATYLYSQNGDLAIGTASSNAIHFVVNSGTTDALTISSTGIISALGTTASTSTTTGALTVAGGVGVAGSVYANTFYDTTNKIANASRATALNILFG
jgi:hypothetical protein